MKLRTVKRLFKGVEDKDGAGVKLIRCFGYNEIPEFDPFLLMDFFDSEKPGDYIKGFPWHPHRGIQTITYLIKGKIEHGDSLGNTGLITDGDCQWMSAGSGIIHQEMPKASKKFFGTQIWLNLSKKEKMSDPKYMDITKKEIPVYIDEKKIIRIIAGEYGGIQGPINDEVKKPMFYDIDIRRNTEIKIDIEDGLNLFIFVVKGEVYLDKGIGNLIGEKVGALYNLEGDLYLRANIKDARILLLGGKPLNEPIAWGGPIVMNTEQELQQAFLDIQKGQFIKSKVE